MTSMFSDIPTVLPGELTETLVQTKGVRIERIVSHGHASPDGFWYDQPTMSGCYWSKVQPVCSSRTKPSS